MRYWEPCDPYGLETDFSVRRRYGHWMVGDPTSQDVAYLRRMER